MTFFGDNQETSLSDKIELMKRFGQARVYHDAIPKRDVKEFIEELKKIKVRSYDYDKFCKEIDKLAGDKLI